MQGRDRFQLGKAIERLEPFLSAMPGFPNATKWQFNTASGTVIIDEHLASPQGLGQSHLSTPITRPDTGHQTIFGAVCDPNGLCFILERDQNLNRSENLFLRQNVNRRDIGKKCRTDISPGFRSAVHDLALRGQGEVLTH